MVMTINGEIGVVFENGVLRPEEDLALPEHTRLVMAIRRVKVSPASEEEGRRLLHDIRDRGLVRLGGWHPTRDEMHERS
ncbi:MAG: antitoxin family protein [Planctomycetes bacterium]|nr:antitoxin family protein [Planctomycetota bacterium]